ncbi:MAG: response regulator [Desulfuromonadaceae bacterium]
METILIIEDSKVMQARLEDSLAKHFRLVFAEDGERGIAIACEKRPDLILLDIYLPQMDGYQVCGILKGDLCTREIPVLFLTSLESEQEKLRGFEAGADDYIVKPFYAGELLARIRLHLASRREKQLALELERLKLLQEMAVALSHEFNNPLTTIFGHLHLAMRELATVDSVSDHLLKIREELEKIHAIVGKLAKASRVVKTDYFMGETMIDLNEI